MAYYRNEAPNGQGMHAALPAVHQPARFGRRSGTPCNSTNVLLLWGQLARWQHGAGCNPVGDFTPPHGKRRRRLFLLQLNMKTCTKCGGDLALDQGDWLCLHCGTYYYTGLYRLVRPGKPQPHGENFPGSPTPGSPEPGSPMPGSPAPETKGWHRPAPAPSGQYPAWERDRFEQLEPVGRADVSRPGIPVDRAIGLGTVALAAVSW